MWRPTAEDPKGLGGWLRQALAVPSTSALLACFALAVPLWLFWALPLILPILLLLPFALAFPRLRPRSSRHLSTLPPPSDTYPVQVSVLSRGARMGQDDAIAAFVDGWLHVEGARAAFALRATDGKARLVAGLPALVVDLADGACVRLDLVAGGWTDWHDFRNSAGRWVRAAERPKGSPVLPPCDAQPAVVVHGLLRTALLLGVLLMVGRAFSADPSSGVMLFRVSSYATYGLILLVAPPLAAAAWQAHALREAFLNRPPMLAKAPSVAPRAEDRDARSVLADPPPERGRPVR